MARLSLGRSYGRTGRASAAGVEGSLRRLRVPGEEFGRSLTSGDVIVSQRTPLRGYTGVSAQPAIATDALEP